VCHMPLDRPLRIALLSYRSKPHCGGQGVYVRHLSRELAALGLQVRVLSGQPYPVLDDGVALDRIASLDLYNDAHPFQAPPMRQWRDWIDALEVTTMCDRKSTRLNSNHVKSSYAGFCLKKKKYYAWHFVR